MEKNLDEVEKKNIKIELNPNNNQQQAEKNITKFLEGYKEKFQDYCKKIETYRTYFKENVIENDETKDKKGEFDKCSKEFNKLLDGFIEEMPQLSGGLEIGKLLLEMLTFMQVAQVKNTRVHIRLHKIELNKSENETRTLLDRSIELEENLKNSNTSVISAMSIFVCIFSLINININFFQTLVEKFGSLLNVTALFLIINATALITLTALFRFIYLFFLRKKDDSNEKNYLSYYLIPIMMFLVGLFMLCLGNKEQSRIKNDHKESSIYIKL